MITGHVDYVPLLFSLDEQVVCEWLEECFAYGLTDNRDGRLEMCRALASRQAKLAPKPARIDNRYWEQTGCNLD